MSESAPAARSGRTISRLPSRVAMCNGTANSDAIHTHLNRTGAAGRAVVVSVAAARQSQSRTSEPHASGIVEANFGVPASCPLSLLEHERLVANHIVRQGVLANLAPQDQPCITVKTVVDSTEQARDGGRLSLRVELRALAREHRA